MPAPPLQSKLQDSVPKVAGEVAVGEDLEFQRKWWRFERLIWSFLLLVLLADVLGLFGRGWLAKAEQRTPDGALTLHYERIERASTPSVMTLEFGNAAVHQGRVQLYVSDSIVKPLGAQRISPQPQTSTIGDGGITYTFPASAAPMTVQIELMPSFPGIHSFEVRVPGSEPIRRKIAVVP